MRPFHAQVAQKSPAVCGLPGNADEVGGVATTRIATAVVENEPVSTRQAELGQQRPEGVRDECPMDEYRGLTGPRDLVLQFSPVGPRPFQRLAPSRHPGGIGGVLPKPALGAPFYSRLRLRSPASARIVAFTSLCSS